MKGDYIMNNNKLYYCPNCLNNGETKETFRMITENGGRQLEIRDSRLINGFVDVVYKLDACPHCGSEFIELLLTTKEWKILKNISTDSDFIFAMDELKKNNIIDFNLKMSQFKTNVEAEKQSKEKSKQTNIPKCPTCGSTNIKKISGTKRYVSTGLFGLGSSNVGKTMECKNCHYKW